VKFDYSSLIFIIGAVSNQSGPSSDLEELILNIGEFRARVELVLRHLLLFLLLPLLLLLKFPEACSPPAEGTSARQLIRQRVVSVRPLNGTLKVHLTGAFNRRVFVFFGLSENDTPVFEVLVPVGLEGTICATGARKVLDGVSGGAGGGEGDGVGDVGGSGLLGGGLVVGGSPSLLCNRFIDLGFT
jgi:hypothetical protein